MGGTRVVVVVVVVELLKGYRVQPSWLVELVGVVAAFGGVRMAWVERPGNSTPDSRADFSLYPRQRDKLLVANGTSVGICCFGCHHINSVACVFEHAAPECLLPPLKKRKKKNSLGRLFLSRTEGRCKATSARTRKGLVVGVCLAVVEGVDGVSCLVLVPRFCRRCVCCRRRGW